MFDPHYTWLGIPPREQPANYYRLLSLELFEDNGDVISNAADRQMLHVRTFQTGPHATLSQKVLNELAAARACLLDREAKAKYDRRLAQRLADANDRGRHVPAPPPVPKSPVPQSPVPQSPVPQSPVPQSPVPQSPVSQSPASGERSIAPPLPPAAPQVQETPVAPAPPPLPASSRLGLCPDISGVAAVSEKQPAAPPTFAADARPLRRRRPSSSLPMIAALALLVLLAVGGIVVWQLIGNRSGDGDRVVKNPASTPRSASERRTRIDDDDLRPASNPLGRVDGSRPANVPSNRPNLPAGKIPFTVGVSAGETTAPRGAAEKTEHVEVGLTGSMPPADVAPATVTPVVESPAVDPSPAAPKRLSVPTGETLVAAKREFDGVYGSMLDKVKTAEEKIALADVLLKDAVDTKVSAGARYLMLDTGYRHAVEAGDFGRARRAVDALAADYDVGAVALRVALFDESAAANAGANAVLREIAIAALDEVPRMVAASRLAEALRVADRAERIAADIKDVPLRKQARDAAADVRQKLGYYRAFETAQETLAADPDDGNAHLVVGRYLCGVVGDWERGLEHLSRARDDAWKAAALLERAPPKTLAEELAVADAWYDVGMRSPEFPGALARAEAWYRRALPSSELVVAEQMRVKQRLDEILSRSLPVEVVRAAELTNASASPAEAGDPATPADPLTTPPPPRMRLSASLDLRGTLSGHSKPVRSIAFSPDGLRLASVADDDTLRLWDVARPGEILTVKVIGTAPAQVVFSRDGKRLATAEEVAGKRVVVLWDEHLDNLDTLGSGAVLTCPAFLPGDSIAAATELNLLKSFNRSGDVLATLHVHDKPVRAVRASPRGTLLASADEAGKLNLYDLAAGKASFNIAAHEAPITAIAISSSDHRIAVATADGLVKVFDTTTGLRVTSFAGEPISSLVFLADDNGIATVGDGKLVIWDAVRGEQRAMLNTHTGAIHALAVSPDGKRLATAGDDRVIKLWDISLRE